MYSKVKTCVLQGLDGHIVEVEVDLSRGMPMFTIVGLPDAAIKESKERVRTAIRNSGFEFPLSRITVNLAPANLKKDGSQMDMAIAAGILIADGRIQEFSTENIAFLGELSLDGTVNPIDGALPMVISLRELGISQFIIPYGNKDECGIIEDVEIIPVKNLTELVEHLSGEFVIKSYVSDDLDVTDVYKPLYDFSDIKGQEGLKRAMEVSAAGAHNLLIVGPPGSGKTMAARRIPGILPHLSFEESIEVTKIYSISGLLGKSRLMKERPFRAPHHSSSGVAIIGGGRIPKPGEVSLAHNGVLFFDELPEFQKSVLEVLRQPLEDGFVHISRANASLSYPSDFMFVASMNPCPCGYYGDPLHQCTCSQNQIDRYLGKISHPLLDRIDLHIEVLPVKYEELNTDLPSKSSDEMRKSVSVAREIQKERFSGLNLYTNSQMGNKEIKRFCKLTASSERIMKSAFDKLRFSGRTYNKILKVARTLADLNESESIDDKHLLEAIQYRSLDKKYWG
ncbi:YifB family Mg chelatase-like AAA ATPase [Gudongella sp. DL1XJH-153]|uniref:YifB family Mg chelatase-like AAA ATPase n=1 Tax=Gudongella sp. DL1XJH-153 TaxID=3409804 RepID=UPI003BB69D93